jgi:putative ABC transport system permease protein
MTGIVASFALAGAMAIMVASFRDSVDRWLETVLPADAYARIGSSTTRSTIDAPLQRRLAGAPGVTRAEFSRMLELTLDVARPPVVLIARPIDVHRPQSRLPITGEVRAPPPGTVAVYASEAVADLYGFVPGERVALPLPGASSKRDFFVAGIWRDYARQHGAIAIDAADYRTLTGDASVNDAALWLDDSREGTDAALGRLRTVLSDIEGLELRATGELRALSLRIFDRSFAVTYALEAIAILVALFGVASAWAAEGLARAREFGVLRHLGLRRRDVARLFAAEAALQIVLATAWGALLGTAIALILIHRVNPQSFHWTMDMSWPAGLLATVAVALLALGVAAAVLAARNAMSDAPVRAVREDW